MDSPFVKIVVPVVGNILGLAMLSSPSPAVWQIRKTQRLGDINPLPYPLTCINCLSWVIYGAVVEDPFIPPANIFGLALGILFTMSVLPTCTRKMQDIIQGILACAAIMFCCLSLVSTFGVEGDERKRMWGLVAIISLMTYYLIPLSTMYDVIKSRDAASIFLPLAVAAIVNGGLWTTYGLAIADVNVWGPNAFGVLMAIIQIGLRLLLGVKQQGKSAESVTANGGSGAECPGSVAMTIARDSHEDDRESLLEQAQPAASPAEGAGPALSSHSHDTNGTWAHTPKHQSSNEV